MGSAKKVTVGYKYALGQHLLLWHGPIDKILRLRWDGRTAWVGHSTGGRINISAAGLFGGEKREGGIAGPIDFENGGPSQGQNDYLLARLGSLVSGFRGVSALVLRQVYIGLNPYLKIPQVRGQRIHVRQAEGLEQWYDAVAETPSPSVISGGETYTNFSDGWETNAPDKFQIIDGMIANTLVNASNSDYWRVPLPVFQVTRFYLEFELIARDLGDPLGFRFDSALGTHLFSFMPQTEDAADPLRRPAVNYWTSYTPIYGSELEQGVRYTFEALFDPDSLDVSYFLRQGATVLSFGIVSRPSGVPAYAVFGRTSNSLPDRTGIAGYSRLEINGFVRSGDMNPAHIVRECNTDLDWGMGYPESDIDDVAFAAAADRLYDERFGLSFNWLRQSTIEDFRADVLRHIDAEHYIDRRTGKFVIKLIRPDYDSESLLVLDESNVERIEGFARPTIDELINTVTVQYWDAATGTPGAVTVDNPALIQMQGQVIPVTVSYDGITNWALAMRVAQRDLRALSNPMAGCTIYANRDAAGLNPGDPFRLVWPDANFSGVMRVSRIAFGDGRSSRVRIQCVEDIFALPEEATAVSPPAEWIDPSQPPGQAVYRAVLEAPYYEIVQRLGEAQTASFLAENDLAGMLLASAANPGGAINAELMVDVGAPEGYESSGTVDFCPFARLASELPMAAGPSIVELTDAQDIDDIRIGSHVQIGTELLRVDAVDAEADPPTMTLGRGVLDTVPVAHAAGTPLLAWDDYADGDETEYVAGTSIDVKLLPLSGSGQVELEAAQTDVVAFLARACRPYPPGNLKVNGEPYPDVMPGDSGLELTWSHRDRVQQTAGELVDTTAGNIGPEPATTYNLRIYGEDGTTLLREEIGLTDAVYDYTTALEYYDVGAVAGLTYADLVTAAAPTHWWRLNEESGTTFTSVVGSWVANISGSHTKGVAGLLAGDADKSVQWSASNSYAQTGFDNAHRLGTGDFTIGCLVKYTGTGFSTVLAVRNGTNPSPILVLITTGRITAGDISAETWAWSDVNTRVRHPGTNDGAPHHATVVYKHSTTTLELWVDGVLRDSRSQGAGRPTTGSLNITLGNNTSINQGYVGVHDEVTMFARALSQAEIEQLADVALNGPALSEGRLNGKLRFELESERDDATSMQHHNITVHRAGWNFSWDRYWNGEI